MGDEQGDRQPPFHVDWIDGPSTHHSDQLGVGRYSPRDFKKDPTSRDGAGTWSNSLDQGLIGVLVGEREKHFGINFSRDLIISERGRF